MNFIHTLVNGEKGLFKPDTLTPMQKMTLRFVVVGLVYYLFAVIEGMLMGLRSHRLVPTAAFAIPRHWSGSWFHVPIVFGAFLGPVSMKTALQHRSAFGPFWLIAIGTFSFSRIRLHYRRCTLLLPLPADFSHQRFAALFFILGIVLIMVHAAGVITIFATITYTRRVGTNSLRALIRSAPFDRFAIFRKRRKNIRSRRWYYCTRHG